MRLSHVPAAMRPRHRNLDQANTWPRSDAGNRPFAVNDLDGWIGFEILLLPDFDLFDLAAVQDVVAIFNRLSPTLKFVGGVRSVADSSVRSSSGLAVAASPSPLSPGSAHNLVVLGGTVAAAAQYAALRFWLRRAVHTSARVFSVNGATFALASAGLMDGQDAAAPWRSIAAWQELYPRVRFKAAAWASGPKFHSSLGGGVLVQMLLESVARQFGVAIAENIALALNSDFRRQRPATSGPQPLPLHCDPALHDAVLAMRGNLAAPLEIAELCALCGQVSERKLQRLFRRYLGTTIYRYYRACRLQHAREMLRLTKLSITEIALSAGFESSTHFSQCCKEHFGCAPRMLRRAT